MPDSDTGAALPASIERAEDPVGGEAKVRGAALFAADRDMPGTLWAAFWAVPALTPGSARWMPAGRKRCRASAPS